MASNDVTEPAVLQPISARQGIVLSLSIEGSRPHYVGQVSIAVTNFGVCDFSRLAVTDWRLRRWRLCFFGAYDSYPNV